MAPAARTGQTIQREDTAHAGQLLRESCPVRRDRLHPGELVPDQPGSTLTDCFAVPNGKETRELLAFMNALKAEHLVERPLGVLIGHVHDRMELHATDGRARTAPRRDSQKIR